MIPLSFSSLVDQIGFGPAVRVCEARLTEAFFDQISFAQCMEAIGSVEKPSELRIRMENAAAKKAANPDECRALLNAYPNNEAKTVTLDRLLTTATCMADCQPAVGAWEYVRREEAMAVALRKCAGKDEAIAAYEWCRSGDDWARLVVEKALSYLVTADECLALRAVRPENQYRSEGKEPIEVLPLKRALELAKTTEECVRIGQCHAHYSFGIAEEAKRRGLLLARTTADCLLLVDSHFASMDDRALKKGIRLAKRTEDRLVVIEKLRDQQRDVRVSVVRRRMVERAIAFARTGEERVAILRAYPSHQSSSAHFRARALGTALSGAESLADWKLVWDELSRNPHDSSPEERAQALAAAQRFVADEATPAAVAVTAS